MTTFKWILETTYVVTDGAYFLVPAEFTWTQQTVEFMLISMAMLG